MPTGFKLLLRSLFHSCRSKDHLPSQPLRLGRPHDPNWHALDGGGDTFAPPPLISVAPPAAKAKRGQRQRRPRRKKAASNYLFRPRLSTSSTTDHNCIFSEKEEEEEEAPYMYMDMEMERETLVSPSSISFYSDEYDSSTDFSPHLETIREGAILRKKRARPPRRGVLDTGEDGEGTPARLSAVFQRLMPCTAVEVELGNRKVRESFAVVKRSDDPYEDFRRSMAEMIVDKEMATEADLKELLRCFLSLNSEHHHATILAAFNHTWEAFFPSSNSNSV